MTGADEPPFPRNDGPCRIPTSIGTHCSETVTKCSPTTGEVCANEARSVARRAGRARVRIDVTRVRPRHSAPAPPPPSAVGFVVQITGILFRSMGFAAWRNQGHSTITESNISTPVDKGLSREREGRKRATQKVEIKSMDVSYARRRVVGPFRWGWCRNLELSGGLEVATDRPTSPNSHLRTELPHRPAC